MFQDQSNKDWKDLNVIYLSTILMIMWAKIFRRNKKAARSPYSLKLRPKIKNFNLFFFRTEKSSLKGFNVVRITTEKDLLWYITPPNPLINWGKQKKKKKIEQQKTISSLFFKSSEERID